MVTITRGYVSIKETILIYTATQVVTFGASGTAADFVDFNPHHHAGGDDCLRRKVLITEISIHTTTQVVTDKGMPQDQIAIISIHTTTQVVTVVPHCYLHHPTISIHTTTQVVTLIYAIRNST